jgi:predicted dehydrogenase
MTKIRIGLVGGGFVSELHMFAYRRVYGVDVEVKAVAARGDHVVDFADRHQIPKTYRSFGDLIADGELDVVTSARPPICTAQ